MQATDFNQHSRIKLALSVDLFFEFFGLTKRDTALKEEI